MGFSHHRHRSRRMIGSRISGLALRHVPVDHDRRPVEVDDIRRARILKDWAMSKRVLIDCWELQVAVTWE